MCSVWRLAWGPSSPRARWPLFYCVKLLPARRKSGSNDGVTRRISKGVSSNSLCPFSHADCLGARRSSDARALVNLHLSGHIAEQVAVLLDALGGLRSRAL